MQKQQLGELLSAVRSVIEEAQKMPRAVSMKVAATLLDVKPTKLKQMVRTGVINQVRYDASSHPKIPTAEIERLTTPSSTTSTFRVKGKTARRPRTSRKQDVASDRATIRAALKKLRR